MSPRKNEMMKRMALAFLLPCVLWNVRLRRNALDEREAAKRTSSCAGWNKIRIKPETAVYLVKNDFSAGIDIDSHNLNGQNNGCWK